MNNNEYTNNQLSNLLYFYRLKKDLALTEDKIEENQLLEITEDQNVIVKFWNKNVENFVRKDELNKHIANKEVIEKRINDFLQEHNDFDFESFSKEDKIYEYTRSELAKDTTSLLRVNLALVSILQSNDFFFKNETKEEISKILFGNKKATENIEKKLEKNYMKICGRTSYDKFGKKVLLGIGIATAIATFKLVSFAGASFLEAIFGSALYTSVIVGTSAVVYKIIDIGQKALIKEHFRELSVEDAGAMFALKATLIEEAKKIMDKNSFEEFLDSNLKLVNDLRADTEFMLLIEQKDTENAKQKIKIFNNWTNRITTLLVS